MRMRGKVGEGRDVISGGVWRVSYLNRLKCFGIPFSRKKRQFGNLGWVTEITARFSGKTNFLSLT